MLPDLIRCLSSHTHLVDAFFVEIQPIRFFSIPHQRPHMEKKMQSILDLAPPIHDHNHIQIMNFQSSPTLPMHAQQHHKFCPPAGLPPPGGMRIPIPPATEPAGLVRAVSTLLLIRLIAGNTQSPQLHCMPCHAYLPTLAWHLGHSRRPSSLPCSSSGRIQERASRK